MKDQRVYEKKLESLYQDILEMGVRVKENIIAAAKAFNQSNTNLAQNVITADRVINDSEMSLEERVIQIIALDHPVATDLRKLVAALKIIAHLERLGDHGVHIAKSVLKEVNIPEKYKEKFDIILEHVIRMIDDVLVAFLAGDENLALSVSKYDNIIDDEYDAILEMLFQEDPSGLTMQTITSIMIIARYLERSGDHIIHICEWVVYAVKSTHVELNQ